MQDTCLAHNTFRFDSWHCRVLLSRLPQVAPSLTSEQSQEEALRPPQEKPAKTQTRGGGGGVSGIPYRSFCSLRSLFTSSLLPGTGPAFSKASFRSWLFSRPNT